MDPLVRIKRLVLRGEIEFTTKASQEMELDDLSVEDVIESVVNARRIEKVLRSRSQFRRSSGEKLYVIKGRTFTGTQVYTKGAIVQEGERQTFYIFVSAKADEGGF